MLLHPTLSLPTSTAVFFEPNLHRLAFGRRESARKMSGPGKKVVDVAFKASKNIDWEGMAKLLVSDEARKEFATLRRTFDEVNSTLQTKFSQVFFFSLIPSSFFILSINQLGCFGLSPTRWRSQLVKRS